jgi:hypothetical protein
MVADITRRATVGFTRADPVRRTTAERITVRTVGTGDTRAALGFDLAPLAQQWFGNHEQRRIPAKDFPGAGDFPLRRVQTWPGGVAVRNGWRLGRLAVRCWGSRHYIRITRPQPFPRAEAIFPIH